MARPSARPRAAIQPADDLPEATRHPFHAGAVDLATIADDALDGRAPTGLTVTATLLDSPVDGDAILLERLIGNLLDNAERYNVPDGMIDISTTTDGTAAVLRVVNTGPIIPAAMVDRLFQPFTRLDDRTRHQGSGLGRTLVASIAAAHGGTVHATAAPTGGLEITVRLPKRESAPDAAPAAIATFE